jgi:hypothetical protein
MCGLWWTKRFSPSTSVYPANGSTNLFIIIFTRVGTVGLLVAVVPSGPNWTPPPIIPIIFFTHHTMPIKYSAGTDTGRREAHKSDGSLLSHAWQTARSASFRLDINVVSDIHKSTLTPKILNHHFLHIPNLIFNKYLPLAVQLCSSA